MERRTFGVFASLYMGYMVITYIRKSVSFASPAIIVSEDLSKSQLGLILSSQMVGYTAGKLVGGLLVDMYSPFAIFLLALLSAALTVFTFTAFSTVSVFALCWFLNGFLQGPGWPACARIIKKLFPPHQFGTWWSVLSTSMNVSGTAGPMLSAFLLSFYSWRFALNVAGTCAIAVSGMAMVVLCDGSPQESKDSTAHSGKVSRQEQTGTQWRDGVWALLRQPVYLATCLNYLLVSLVRGACNDWGHLYLIQERNHSHLTGSSFTSCQELGGIMGSLAAGYISDFLMAKKVSGTNPRQLVILFCTILQSAAIFFFLLAVGDDSSSLTMCVVGCCLGFGMYGSIALFGVVAMESAEENLAGTAHSIISLAASVGMVLSGFPLSMVSRLYSWYITFWLVMGVAMLTVTLSVFCVSHSFSSSSCSSASSSLKAASTKTHSD